MHRTVKAPELARRLAQLCGLWALCYAAHAGDITVEWTNPIENVDASPLTDLATVCVYYGTTRGNYPNSQCKASTIPGAQDSLILTGLPDATPHYVAATAIDLDGNASAFSNEVGKMSSGAPLQPPGPVDAGSQITWQHAHAHNPPNGPPMSVKFAVVEGAAPTTATTQTFTGPSGFGNPKAVMFFIEGGTALGTAHSHALMGAGFTDGTAADDRATSVASVDAGTSSDTYRSMRRGKCVQVLNGSGAVDGEAEWDAWVTDGVRIDWTDPPASAVRVVALLIGGTDVTANVVETNLATSGTTDIAHGLGEVPELAFFLGTTGSATSVGNVLVWNLGVMHYDQGTSPDTIVQRQLINYQRDNRPTAENTEMFNENRIFGSLAQNAISRLWEVTAVDATNIEFTHRGPSAFGGDVQALVIGFGAATNKIELGTFDSRITVGTQQITNADSFRPQFIMLGGSNAEVVNTFDTTVQPWITSVGLIDGTNEYSVAMASNDAATDMETAGIVANKAIHRVDGLDNDVYIASILTGSGSINTDGFTLDVTSESITAAKKFFYLMVEEDAAASNDITATSTLIFGETAALNAVGEMLATDPLTFGETAAISAVGEVLSTSGLVFGETAALNAVGEIAATSGLVFGEAAALNAPGELLATSTLIFGEAGADLTGLAANDLTATSTLVFGETAGINAIGEMASTSGLVFGEAAALNAAGELLATSTLVFAETADLQGAGGNDMTSTSTLVFGETAALNAVGEIAATSGLVFGETAALNAVGGLLATSTLVFGEAGADLTGLAANDLTATSTLVFGETAGINAIGEMAATSGLVFAEAGAALVDPDNLYGPIDKPGLTSGTSRGLTTSTRRGIKSSQ